MAKFTTKHLQRKLLDALNSGGVAHGNMVARIGAVMIAAKQLELNEKAHGQIDGVVLIEEEPAPMRIAG